MKKGEDQRPGLLGIGMAAKNPNPRRPSWPPSVPIRRPARPGFKKGDRIVEINGKPIKTQTDLRFALGTRYGGEKMKVAAMRGQERFEREVTLVGQLEPFRNGFLGILPLRPTEAATDDADEDKAENSKKSDKPAADNSPDDRGAGCQVASRRRCADGLPGQYRGRRQGPRRRSDRAHQRGRRRFDRCRDR